MSMYLSLEDYEEMTDTTVESEYEYLRMEYKAAVMINRMTFLRLSGEKPVRECVKYLMVELINIQKNANANASQLDSGVKSVSNDGVSMSFASGLELSNSIAERSIQLIRDYLFNETTKDGVPLLSRVVNI